MREELIETVTYKDKDELVINHLSLILNVRSINLKCGSVWDFISGNKLFGGTTNGKILVYQAKGDYDDYYFKSVIKEILHPLGLNYIDDFIISGYLLPYGNSYSAVKPEMIEKCQGISTDWLVNQKTEGGCILKFRKTNNNSYPSYTIEELQKKLIKYFELTEPRKLDFNLQVIGYENGKIIFGMSKHYGRFLLSIEKLQRTLYK